MSTTITEFIKGHNSGHLDKTNLEMDVPQKLILPVIEP